MLRGVSHVLLNPKRVLWFCFHAHVMHRFSFRIWPYGIRPLSVSFGRLWVRLMYWGTAMIFFPINIKLTSAKRNYFRKPGCFPSQAKNNLTEIDKSWPTPFFPSLFPYNLLLIHNNAYKCAITVLLRKILINTIPKSKCRRQGPQENFNENQFKIF